MSIKSFKDLQVWQKAFEVSIDIHKSSMNFPKEEQFSLTSQMRRASKSICANIAEGFSRQYDSNNEYKRYISMALGSANEMLVWLEYVERLQYANPKTIAAWKEEYAVICKMLKSLHKSRCKI